MLRPGRIPHERYALRLWSAPVLLEDGAPLWLGTTQTLHLAKPLGAAVLWLPRPHDGEAHALVTAALEGFDMQQGLHPNTGVNVLRVRTGP